MKKINNVDRLDATCFVCGTIRNLHQHEVFFGSANRKLSIMYGCQVYLCARHHNMSSDGVHSNKQLDTKIKKHMQEKFEKVYSRKKFTEVFGRNYL